LSKGLKGNDAFKKQIKKGYDKSDLFVLDYPKGELKKHLPDYHLAISGAIISKAMSQLKDHNLNWQNFFDLPEALENPQAIFKSKSKGVVVLTYMKDVNKKPLMVPVHIENKRKTNFIASIYARSNFNTYKKWVKDGLALYVDKKSELSHLPQ